MKIQKTTLHETMRIAIGITVMSVVMNIVFIVIGQWDLGVLWGTLLGSGFACLNFFLMALTVQKMASNHDDKRMKLQFQASYSARQFFMFVVVAIGLLVPVFNGVAVIIPQLFPKFTIFAMQLLGLYKPEKSKKEDGEN